LFFWCIGVVAIVVREWGEPDLEMAAEAFDNATRPHIKRPRKNYCYISFLSREINTLTRQPGADTAEDRRKEDCFF